MNMYGGKINGFDGYKKSHSIMRELVPFLEGLTSHSFIRNVGCGRMVHCRYSPLESVELRGYCLDGSRHHLKTRVYGLGAYQEIFIFCNKSHFPEVLKYINQYCEKKSR